MKTTRVSIALSIIHLIRSEKNPPLARYEILLAMANFHDAAGKPIPATLDMGKVKAAVSHSK